jgi:PhnB protein
MYVEDVDSIFEQVIKNVATSLNKPEDKFYGNRDCGVIDIKGNYWFIASMIEQLTEKEITQRITPKIRK